MNKAESRKMERLARLHKIEQLLYQHHTIGISVKRLAELCEVSTRTIYRDLNTLESEQVIPIWEKGSSRGIIKDSFLPPIQFSRPEALNIFLAARLMLDYSHRYDPTIASTFIKLNCVVPPPLNTQILKTLDWMAKQPRDDRYRRTVAKLTEAWISQRRAKISYRALQEEESSERVIEPYAIEPAAAGHSLYAIAYCLRTHSLRTFKIERIESIELTSEPYDIPASFDASEFFSNSMGIIVEGETKTIKLRFAPYLARVAEETIWHPSQTTEKQKDGSVIMTLRVSDTTDLYSFILRWGEAVEVLEPPEVRQNTIATASAMLELYEKEGAPQEWEGFPETREKRFSEDGMMYDSQLSLEYGMGEG